MRSQAYQRTLAGSPDAFPHELKRTEHKRREPQAGLPGSLHTPCHGSAQQCRIATWVPLSEFQIHKSHLKTPEVVIAAA